MGTYVVGTPLRLSFTFTSEGTLADPAAILLEILSPDGTLTSKTLADAQILQDSTGHFHYDLVGDELPAVPGKWYYRVTSTNPAESAGESTFFIVPSRVLGE